MCLLNVVLLSNEETYMDTIHFPGSSPVRDLSVTRINPPPSISVSLPPLLLMGLLTITLLMSIIYRVHKLISHSPLIVVTQQTSFLQFQLDYVSSLNYYCLWCLNFSLVQYLGSNLNPLNVAACVPYYITVYAENQVGRGLETQGINFTMPCSKEYMKYTHVQDSS